MTLLQHIPTNRTYLIFTLLFLQVSLSKAQDPYIDPNQGLGRYGYLELDGTTYATLVANGNNYREFSARWYITSEYIYYPGDKGSCDATSQSVGNYSSSNHAGWNAGNIAYVSSWAKGCDFRWYPGNQVNAGGGAGF
ncbi:MAG: hypothetical protein KDC54_01725, partial [Lewinella sp.]|nr:hypothetical protein [Lewinella sp.]